MISKVFQKPVLYNLILGLGIILFAINSTMGTLSPISQDEAGTIFLIKSLDIKEIIFYFYNGNDTQLPFYFLIIKVITLFFNSYSLILLRVISIIFGVIGIIFNFLLFRDFIRKELFGYYLLLISMMNYFIYYYLAFARPYALFYCLFSIFFYLLLKFHKNNNRGYLILLFFVSLLMTFTHYFGSLYLIFISIFLLFYNSKQVSWIILTITFSLLFFIIWIPGIANQLEVHNRIIYHKLPTTIEVLMLPQKYFNYLGYTFLLLIIYFYLFEKKHLKKDSLFLYTLLFFVSLFPIFYFLLSLTGYSVFADRYFVPTYNSILLLSVFSFSGLIYKYPKVELTVVILLILILVPHRIYEANKFNKKIVSEYSDILKLEQKLPVIFESPSMFFPIFHELEFNEDNDIYLVLDKFSAKRSFDKESALFDYYGMKNFKQNFATSNIVNWDEIIINLDSFYIYNQKKVSLFEHRILSDTSLLINQVLDSVYHVKKR